MTAFGKNLGVQYDYSMEVNHRPCRYLQFEYDDFRGQRHSGKSSYLSEKQIARLQNVTEVPVIYLPDAPDTADLDFERIEDRH
jgi:hypothetical protein